MLFWLCMHADWCPDEDHRYQWAELSDRWNRGVSWGWGPFPDGEYLRVVVDHYLRSYEVEILNGIATVGVTEVLGQPTLRYRKVKQQRLTLSTLAPTGIVLSRHIFG